MKNPTISVLMSVYNGEPYLSESIESILNQTYRDFEFIIINDGSTDSSWETIQHYAAQDGRVIPISQGNIGLTKSLNRGIQLARGEYIARQDADDVSEPNRLQEQNDWFSKNKHGILCGTQGKIQHNDKFIKIPTPLLNNRSIVRKLIYGNVFNHTSAMFRKTINDNTFLYNENFKYAQDYELWSRLCLVGEVNIIKNHLVIIRDNPGNLSNRQKEYQRLFAILVALSNNFPEIKNKLTEYFDIEEMLSTYRNDGKYAPTLDWLFLIHRIRLSQVRLFNVIFCSPDFFEKIYILLEKIFIKFNIFVKK